MKSVRFFADKNSENESPNLLVIENQPEQNAKDVSFRSDVHEFSKDDCTKLQEDETLDSDCVPQKKMKECGVVKTHDTESQVKEIEQYDTVPDEENFHGSPLYKVYSPPTGKDVHENTTFKEAGINYLLDKFRNFRHKDLFASDHEHTSIFNDIKKKFGRPFEAKTEKKGDVTVVESYQPSEYVAPLLGNSLLASERHASFRNSENEEVPQDVKSTADISALNNVEKGEECYEDMPSTSVVEKTKLLEDVPSKDEVRCVSSQDVQLGHHFDSANQQEVKQMRSDMSVTLSSVKAKHLNEADLDEENEYFDTSPFCSSDVCDTNREHSIDEAIVSQEEKQSFKTWLLLSFSNIKCSFIWKCLNPFYFFLTLTVCAIILCLPIAAFVKGFLNGISLSLLSTMVLWNLIKPPKEKTPLKFSECVYIPPPTDTKISEEDPLLFKGWMNEFCGEYNPKTFRMSSARSVYVQLEGTILRLSFSKKNIPNKAMWNESEHELNFFHQIHYDILDAKVLLVPSGLNKTPRLWKRNYPIQLTVLNVHQKHSIMPLKKNVSSEHHEKENDSKETLIRTLSSTTIHPENSDAVVYLFARTNKEKEEWYYRFCNASCRKVKFSHLKPLGLSQVTEDSFVECLPPKAADKDIAHEESIQYSLKQQLESDKYTDTLLKDNKPSYHQYSEDDLSTNKENSKGTPLSPYDDVFWLNIFIARIFGDFLSQKHWADIITVLIQKKLNKIKVPNFMHKLKVSDVFLGTSLPVIHKVCSPTSDLRGLWINLVIEYSGSFQMTLETKVDITPLQRSPKKTDGNAATMNNTEEHKETRNYDDDEEEEDDSEDSSHSSDEHLSDVGDSGTLETSAINSRKNTGAKVVKFLEKIAQSHYFQQVTENVYLKKAIAGVANIPLILTVEVLGLCGTLTLNIPPPPSDRLWYGFQQNSQLSISARPKLGEIEVNFAHVSDWIEKKLISEFQKFLILPNMDDIKIPILESSVVD